jgi:integrase
MAVTVWSPRRDGKPGGLAPQHILAVHRCLHRALAQAVTWRLLARNAATDATPPPVPSTEVVTLAPQQVALLLDAAGRTASPWLGTWTILAAATGARNGELCGLEWADLDLDAGTIRFRQALTIIDPTVLSDDADGDGGAGGGGGRDSWLICREARRSCESRGTSSGGWTRSGEYCEWRSAAS